MSQQIYYISSTERWVFDTQDSLWRYQLGTINMDNWITLTVQSERPESIPETAIPIDTANSYTVIGEIERDGVKVAIRLPKAPIPPFVGDSRTPNMDIFKAGMRRYKSA